MSVSQGKVLVVDDEKLIRWTLRECLRGAEYEVTEADCGEAALEHVARDDFDLVLLDFKLPDVDGKEVLRRIRVEQPDLPVIMITAHSNVEHAVDIIRAGATDYVAKPFRNEDILARTDKVLEHGRLQREVRRLRREQLERYGFDRMIGSSPAMQKILRVVDRIIGHRDATVLIEGESGTGKDVLAKAIHHGGPRAEAPYTNITCTALPESLLESELFGHERGAFTDARSQKKGLFELANGGTLFLDEIGDMSGYLQGKILRFLEDRVFRRVGGDRDIRVDVRVIAATNKDLRQLVKDRHFREDLYFRLKVIPLHLPPLRERKEDIPLLVQHFVETYNREFKKRVQGTTPALLERLVDYPWPGNIRELKNTLERAMILSTQDYLDEDNLPLELFDEPEGDATRREGTSRVQLTRNGLNLEELEKDLVQQALRLTRGNQTRAGKLLGINRDQVRYRIEKFGLQVKAEASGDNGA